MEGQVHLGVRNVGGISAADVTLSPGVTLVSGENASNKSSLLRSLCGVLGGPLPPLKSDAETGSVRLELAGSAYCLDLERHEGETVATNATVYSAERDLCELFVALTETNPIRQAVLTGDTLSDLLMRPVDTADIEAEIERLTAEKQSIDDDLAELDRLASRLPGLRTRKNSLEENLAAVEASLREKRDAVAEIEAETETAPDEDADADVAAQLAEKRTHRDELRDRIRTQEDAIESLEAEREEVAEELADVERSETSLADVEEELEQLHYQKQQLTSTINALSPIVEMNAQFLDDSDDIPPAMKSEDVVAELDPTTQQVTCWTCGSTVERAEIANQVEAVREILREKRNQRDTITSRIQSLTERKRDCERRQETRERLADREAEIDAEIERREARLADLRRERRALETEIESLQADREETTAADEQVAERYDEISEIEYERGQLASDLESVVDEISEIEATLDRRGDLEVRRERVAEELQTQRNRIERLERDLVSTFNETIQRVLETLSYDDVERVWLERRATGNGTATDTEFDLHVVRVTEDGTAYDDTVEHLSKSEREVIGLVVALAGYLVHDVSSEIPFIVVDAVEMFDADRIHGLMEHFSDHATYVVGTVLPENRAELDGVYETISTQTLTADS